MPNATLTPIEQLKRLVRRLQILNLVQLIPDTLVVYGLFQFFTAKSAITLFYTTFDRQTAEIVILLFALIDLCFTGLRHNDKVAGRAIVADLRPPLSDEDEALVNKFQGMR